MTSSRAGPAARPPGSRGFGCDSTGTAGAVPTAAGRKNKIARPVVNTPREPPGFASRKVPIQIESHGSKKAA